MGSYANQVILEYPAWFISSRRIRSAGIDRCIAEEIQSLWEQGIQTAESCCGHNKAPGYIAVLNAHIPKMLELGYENLILPGAEGFGESGLRPDIFKPKS